MAYRFTDTNKWDDDWFFELKGFHKLVWFYILDKCDNAGFYTIPKRKACFELGITDEQYLGALKGLERGLQGSDCGGYFYVKNFLRHQKNLPLKESNPAHKQIIRITESYKDKFKDLRENKGAFKGLLSPQGKVKVKDKVKVMDFYMERIGSWFKRKPETKWTKKEHDSYIEIKDIIIETIDEMEKYYTSDSKYKRKDIQTLLNNWNGELDRARGELNKQEEKREFYNFG